ncbi:hypothetical protein JTB14_017833 [Gonioctena quinquepunctata]|nr:hypothetical protein JTB14_017833 [Gonioctena quinquepunctata]
MRRKPLHTNQGMQGKKDLSSWPLYGLVSSVAIACYLNGLNGDFVHDDIPAVTLNKDVLAINPLGHVFKNDFWGTPMADLESHKSYRPLTTMTFRPLTGTLITFRQNEVACTGDIEEIIHQVVIGKRRQNNSTFPPGGDKNEKKIPRHTSKIETQENVRVNMAKRQEL